MIQFILDECRRVSKEKNKKKLTRALEAARMQLIKSTEKQVEDLFVSVKNEGAENVFK